MIVVSGFSGAGKGTLMNRLLELHPEEYALSVSATTRDPRPGEIPDVSYHYWTQERFDQMIGEGGFLEYARYVGHSYGTPRAFVDENLAAGKNVILEIELQGAMKVRAARPDTVLLFVTPPDADTLKKRLVDRGTESAEVIQKRLERAVAESDGMENYDYLVVNDDLDTCVEEMHHIIQSEHFRASRKAQLIKDMQNDLKKFSKGA